MILHIRYIIISLLLVFNCKQDETLKQQQQKLIPVGVSKSVEKENFIFFKSFQFCNSPYAALTSEEADKIYLKKEVLLNKEEKREVIDWNSFFFEGAKKCVESVLKQKINTAFLYSSNENFPFDTMVYLNEEYLLTAQDGFFFVFEEQKESSKLTSKQTKEYTCKEIDVSNSYEEPLYKECHCNSDFNKCYSLFYKNIEAGYKEFLLEKLSRKDTVFFRKGNKVEFKFYRGDSLRISIIEEVGEEFLFKNEKNKTVIEFYSYLP